jgi:hypothetical protein
LKQERISVIQEQCLDLIIGEVIRAMYYDIAAESIDEGRAAKISAEQISGIVFAQPVGMQYNAYCNLRDAWKRRKQELKFSIQLLQSTSQKKQQLQSAEADGGGDSGDGKTKEGQAAKLLEQKKLERQEAARQERLCGEMAAEEALCRAFYSWELKANLQERRQMREAEAEMRTYLKDLKRQKDAEASTYNVTHKAGAPSKYAGLSEFERKRQELKDIALERRFIADELARMTVEDELSAELRNEDRIERQKKAFLEQLGIEGEDDADELGAESVKTKTVKLDVNEPPEWMILPPSWNEMNRLKKEKYMYQQLQLRMHRARIDKNADRDFVIRQKVMSKSMTLWQERYDILYVRDLQAELACVISEEECKEIESTLVGLKENIRKLGVYCQQKGMEELKANTALRELTELAKRRDIEHKRASDWVDVCINRSKQRAKVKRRVEEDCKWVDTSAINGFHQRFRTEQLRSRLYTDFFKKTVDLISCRAEIIATERHLMKIQEKLSVNRHALKQKLFLMKDVWAEYRRETYMRTRRSVLNKKFFPHSRRQVLEQRFVGWVRYFLWNRGNREAFEIKYELLKRQMDIDRQFKDQLQSQRLKRLNSSVQANEASAQTAAPTLMERHRERTVECKLCRNFYLESQNTSISCQYHPMKFTSECPMTCPNPGFTALCISHRKKRWPCCDKGQENISGCARRYHIPVDSDPVYDKIMQKVVERDAEHLNELDNKLDTIKKGDWIQKAQDMKRAQVFSIEDDLVKQRETAARAASLKYI